MRAPRKEYSFCLGGTLADIPLPHIRLFSDRRLRRKVTVTVHKYSIGQHYWVSMDEEDNPIWNSTEQRWQSAHDDREVHGRSISRKFDDPITARRFIEKVLRRLFPKRTHQVRWRDEAVHRWLNNYKEGD